MDDQVIDFQDALDRVQDDQQLLFELFDIFEEDFQIKRRELEKYLRDGNAEMIRNIAHSLKGASGNISARQINAICARMEKDASEERLDGISQQLKDLDERYTIYCQEAQRLRQENQGMF